MSILFCFQCISPIFSPASEFNGTSTRRTDAYEKQSAVSFDYTGEDESSDPLTIIAGAALPEIEASAYGPKIHGFVDSGDPVRRRTVSSFDIIEAMGEIGLDIEK